MMNKEEIFALAKESILGAAPANRNALIGYNVAMGYYDTLIEEAEAVLAGIQVPKSGLPTYLKNAFEFSSYEAFKHFPKEARKKIDACCDNFRERYEPLLDRLELRAA